MHKRLSTLKKKKASVLAPTTSINSSYERTAQSYTKIDKMVGYISVDFRIARTNLEPPHGTVLTYCLIALSKKSYDWDLCIIASFCFYFSGGYMGFANEWHGFFHPLFTVLVRELSRKH